MTPTVPSTSELLELVAEYLEQDDGSAFRRKVAISALRIVERELRAAPRPLPVDSTHLDDLRRDVMARLAVDNPGYPALTRARERWPALTQD
jgi:hypothetical protein